MNRLIKLLLRALTIIIPSSIICPMCIHLCIHHQLGNDNICTLCLSGVVVILLMLVVISGFILCNWEEIWKD